MRLYKLISRHGQLKKRMYPWFDPPPVGAPKKYDGWTWNPAEREWVEDDVARIEIEVQVPKYPRPAEPPRLELPAKVTGWQWSDSMQEWFEVAMPTERVQREMERPPQPVGPPRPAQPLYVPGWYWNGRAGLWEEGPLTPQELSEGIEAGPKPEYPPGPEVSWRVDGWVWSSTQLKWNESPMPLEWVEVEQERGPKPEYAPAEAIPKDVEGWSWSETTQEWVATIIFAERIGFTPPRSLPPGVDLASVFPADPYFEMSVRAAEVLAAAGRWDVLANGDAYFKLVAQVHKLQPAAKYPHLIAQGVFEARTVMHAKRVWLSSQEAWQMRVNALAPKAPDYFGTGVFLLTLGTFFALTGFLIGSIMERLAFVDEESFVLVAPRNTYLLGPENWDYSKNIGKSIGGRTYYSHCGSIGEVYTRHKRARGKGGYDVIDFLGGFVETGFKFPYWIKYRWSHWTLQYIGMLESSGERFYRLKERDYDGFATVKAGYSVREAEWCTDFHYYL